MVRNLNCNLTKLVDLVLDFAPGMAPTMSVLGPTFVPQELVITIESTLDRVGCADCGVRAQSQDRVTVDVRDLPCFGRPAHPAEI